MNTIEKFNQHIMSSYGRYDLVIDEGKDRSCVDENGKKGKMTKKKLSKIFMKIYLRKIYWVQFFLKLMKENFLKI